MVEGGGVVHTQFLADDLVDELQLVVAPFFVGDSSAPRFVTRRPLPVERGAAREARRGAPDRRRGAAALRALAAVPGRMTAGGGPASWVTLARAALAAGVAALAVDLAATRALLVALAAVALALDAVDGWVARRTGTATAFGARFDGEVDAFLILALSVYVAPAYGAWVLAIGAARYVFLAGEWLLPWMRAPLPPRRWRGSSRRRRASC